MSSHARALAEQLAGKDDTALAELLARREVRPGADWDDLFDAAEALLEPSSIQRILPSLPRERAALLAQAASTGSAVDDAALRALALVDADGVPLPGVAALLPAIPAPPAPSDTRAPLDERVTARAAERAFTTVAAVADALLLAQETPFALLTNGTVGMAEKRRAAERGLPDDPDLLDDLLSIAIRSALLRPIERSLRMTTSGEDWLRRPGVERWSLLATAFRDRLPEGVRDAAGGWIAPEAWPSAYPWDETWPATAADLRRQAELLGLLVDGAETPWAAPLATGGAADVAALGALLPPEVDRIFLQNDLTAIAPGPLLPALDLRLRTIASRESASQASSYRFTADGVAAAFAAGETEESVLAFLEEISLTGVPQPLRYLVGQASQRHGLIRVRTAGGTTRIDSSDAHLLEAIAVDQALRPLGLVADGGALLSRVGREAVFWALTDEHYPATLIGTDGREETVARTAPVDPEPEPDAVDRYSTLIARLRASQGSDAESAWLDRELEHAVRNRAVLAVEVAMPDGSSRELILEATGLGGGRLRGRDRAADVERTLPVRSIRSTRVVDPDA